MVESVSNVVLNFSVTGTGNVGQSIDNNISKPLLHATKVNERYNQSLQQGIKYIDKLGVGKVPPKGSQIIPPAKETSDPNVLNSRAQAAAFRQLDTTINNVTQATKLHQYINKELGVEFLKNESAIMKSAEAFKNYKESLLQSSQRLDGLISTKQQYVREEMAARLVVQNVTKAYGEQNEVTKTAVVLRKMASDKVKEQNDLVMQQRQVVNGINQAMKQESSAIDGMTAKRTILSKQMKGDLPTLDQYNNSVKQMRSTYYGTRDDLKQYNEELALHKKAMQGGLISQDQYKLEKINIESASKALKTKTSQELADMNRKKTLSEKMFELQKLEKLAPFQGQDVNLIKNLKQQRDLIRKEIVNANIAGGSKTTPDSQYLDQLAEINKRLEIAKASKATLEKDKAVGQYQKTTEAAGFKTSLGLMTSKQQIDNEIKALDLLEKQKAITPEMYKSKVGELALAKEMIKTDDMIAKGRKFNIDSYRQGRERIIDVNKQFGGTEKQLYSDLLAYGKKVEKTGFSHPEVNENMKKYNANLKEITSGFGTQIAVMAKWAIGWTTLYAILRGIQQGFMSTIALAIEFDKTLYTFAAIMQSTRSDAKELAMSGIDIGLTFGKSFNEVSSAMELWVRQGKKGKEAIDLTRQSLLLASIGAIKDAEATNILTSVIAEFGLKAEDAARVVDILSYLDKKYAVSTAELGASLKLIGPIARDFGYSLEETAGTLTAVISTTRLGASQVGNAMKTIFTRIRRPDVIRDLYDIADVTSRTNEGFASLGTVFSQLNQKWDSLTESEREYIAETVAGVRQIGQFRALMNSFSVASKATNDAFNSSGSAMQSFDTIAQSINMQLSRLSTGFQKFGIIITESGLGDALSSTLTTLTAIGSTFQWLAVVIGAGSKITKWVVEFVAFAAIMKGISIAVTVSWNYMAAGYVANLAMMRTATLAFTTFLKTNWIFLVAGLIAAGYDLYSQSQAKAQIADREAGEKIYKQSEIFKQIADVRSKYALGIKDMAMVTDLNKILGNQKSVYEKIKQNIVESSLSDTDKQKFMRELEEVGSQGASRMRDHIKKRLKDSPTDPITLAFAQGGIGKLAQDYAVLSGSSEPLIKSFDELYARLRDNKDGLNASYDALDLMTGKHKSFLLSLGMVSEAYKTNSDLIKANIEIELGLYPTLGQTLDNISKKRIQNSKDAELAELAILEIQKKSITFASELENAGSTRTEESWFSRLEGLSSMGDAAKNASDAIKNLIESTRSGNLDVEKYANTVTLLTEVLKENEGATSEGGVAQKDIAPLLQLVLARWKAEYDALSKNKKEKLETVKVGRELIKAEQDIRITHQLSSLELKKSLGLYGDLSLAVEEFTVKTQFMPKKSAEYTKEYIELLKTMNAEIKSVMDEMINTTQTALNDLVTTWGQGLDNFEEIGKTFFKSLAGTWQKEWTTDLVNNTRGMFKFLATGIKTYGSEAVYDSIDVAANINDSVKSIGQTMKQSESSSKGFWSDLFGGVGFGNKVNDQGKAIEKANESLKVYKNNFKVYKNNLKVYKNHLSSRGGPKTASLFLKDDFNMVADASEKQKVELEKILSEENSRKSAEAWANVATSGAVVVGTVIGRSFAKEGYREGTQIGTQIGMMVGQSIGSAIGSAQASKVGSEIGSQVASGAASGAATGSAGGIWGAAIGAIVGAIFGGWAGSQFADDAKKQEKQTTELTKIADTLAVSQTELSVVNRNLVAMRDTLQPIGIREAFFYRPQTFHNGGTVPYSGLHNLQAGETVLKRGQNSVSVGAINVNITGNASGDDVVQALENAFSVSSISLYRG